MNAWKDVEILFHAAAELTGEARRQYLDEHCAGAPELRAEVEELLRHDEECQSLLGPLVGEVASLASAAQPVRAGPYRILKEIGRGGMGAVYLAERDDEHYRQQVALKLVRAGMDFTDVLRRFRHERQILAQLQHPNIARLLDGGATAEGTPYLVMEYIDGVSIRSYVRDRRLTPREIAALMIPVCDAVAHAHRNLVVHRDIKPGNILVTPDGTPKLLDFGIAKLTESSGDDPGGPTRQWMTPEYASPEQKAGGPVTTASDVYSLGAVLHELLTGVRPGAASSPRIASADLRTIVEAALHEEPDRRYASADALKADLRNFVEDRPILARGDSIWYRAGKFVLRNRAAAAACAVLALSATTGAVATFWQARRAALEGAKAERRFKEVRSLAKTFLFEFHDKVLDLPNSTGVRELIVQRSVSYLDRLSRDAPGDVELQRELAAAYERVGDLMDSPQRQNLGKTAEARQNWLKAIAIVESLEAAGAANTADRLLAARSHCHLGRSILLRDQKPALARPRLERCLALAMEELARTGTGNRDAARAQFYPRQILMDSDTRAGRINEAMAQGETILRLLASGYERPGAPSKYLRATTLSRIARLQGHNNEWEAMLRSYREAVRLNRELLAEKGGTLMRRNLFTTLHHMASIGQVMRTRGYPVPDLEEEALEQLALARQLRQDDALNAQAEIDYMAASMTAGHELLQSQPQKALQCFREAEAVIDSRQRSGASNTALRIAKIELQGYLEKLRRSGVSP